VTKLLALSGPCTAIFGEKDFQQLAVIRRLVADLFLPVEVVGFPIVREPDGLAMSSRNAYLSAEDRKRALCIYAGLSAARGQYQSGERRVGTLRALVVDAVKAGADAVDYITLADAKTLRPLEEGQRIVSPAVLAIACRVGTTRLIDNMTFGEDLTGSGAS
jgi:pantoate--beta-alanine ligase